MTSNFERPARLCAALVAAVMFTTLYAPAASAQEPPPSDSPTTTTTTPDNPRPVVAPDTPLIPDLLVPPPPTTPPPLDVAAIEALLAAAHNAAVDQATTAGAALVSSAEAAVAASARAAADAEADLTAAAQRERVVREEFDTARAALEGSRQTLSSAAVDAYMAVGTSADIVTSSELAFLNGDDVTADLFAAKTYSSVAGAHLSATLDAARSTMSSARDNLDTHIARTEDVTTRALAASRSAADATAALSGARADAEALIRTARDTAQVPPVGDRGLTLTGPTMVSAADMAAFVRAKGKPHPSVNLDDLATAFVTEGDSENIRADVAWIQSIIETGWFSFRASMVDPSDHNYAGIGACDSCSTGYRYATPSLGARAQIQLLKIYATPKLTSADLSNPPVRSTPERVSVRGCCTTWMGLSGVWATGPGYGVKILTLYNELLSFAASRTPLS